MLVICIQKKTQHNTTTERQLRFAIVKYNMHLLYAIRAHYNRHESVMFHFNVNCCIVSSVDLQFQVNRIQASRVFFFNCVCLLLLVTSFAFCRVIFIKLVKNFILSSVGCHFLTAIKTSWLPVSLDTHIKKETNITQIQRQKQLVPYNNRKFFCLCSFSFANLMCVFFYVRLSDESICWQRNGFSKTK